VAVIVCKEVWDVDQRLRALGLTTELLVEVVRAIVQAKAGCTTNDPPAAPCWLGWQMGTRRARELLRPLGWEKDDTDTWSVVVNHELRIRIVVVNSNPGTGIELGKPLNVAKKGPKSTQSAYENRQTVFDIAGFLEDYERSVRSERASRYSTWCLCAFIDDDIVRAELSKPEQYTGGFIATWHERILFLPDGSLLHSLFLSTPIDPLADGDDGLSPDFPIEVRRK